MLIKKLMDTVTFRKQRDRKRLTEWYAHGQRGSSSEAIARVLGMGSTEPHPAHPHDSGDFMRCQRMLEYVGWEDRIHEMERFGGAWKGLAANWGMLAHAFYLEIEGNTPCGTLSAMIKHLELYPTLRGFDVKNHPSHFTRTLDLPGLYVQDRTARGLSMTDTHYPREAYQIGTHRWRVFLSWPEAQKWADDANDRLSDKALTGQLRSSYKKAVAALESYVATQKREDDYHRNYLREGSRY